MDHKELMKISIKDEEWSHYYVLFYRFVSLPLIELFINVPPNIVTFLSLIFGIISAYFYITFSPIIALIFFQTAVILDHIDGPIARIKKQTSVKGAWFDSFVDKVNVNLLILAMTIGIYSFHNSTLILILGFILLAIRNLRFNNELLMDNLVNYKKNIQSGKEKIKGQFALFTISVKVLLDLILFLFPFIVFFGLEIIIPFYIVYIFSEIFRLLIDLIFIINNKNLA